MAASYIPQKHRFPVMRGGANVPRTAQWNQLTRVGEDPCTVRVDETQSQGT